MRCFCQQGEAGAWPSCTAFRSWFTWRLAGPPHCCFHFVYVCVLYRRDLGVTVAFSLRFEGDLWTLARGAAPAQQQQSAACWHHWPVSFSGRLLPSGAPFGTVPAGIRMCLSLYAFLSLPLFVFISVHIPRVSPPSTFAAGCPGIQIVAVPDKISHPSSSLASQHFGVDAEGVHGIPSSLGSRLLPG